MTSHCTTCGQRLGPGEWGLCAGCTGDALVARMEALAAEADAGGDHPTAARIRAALYDDDNGGDAA